MYSNKSSADFLIRHLGNRQKHVTIEISVQDCDREPFLVNRT